MSAVTSLARSRYAGRPHGDEPRSHCAASMCYLAAGGQLLVLGAQCTYTCSMSSKAERLHLRVDPEQKALLEAASRAAGDTVSGFVLRPATEAPGLRELLSAPTVLDQSATEPPPAQAGR